jgi:hypothetical protein
MAVGPLPVHPIAAPRELSADMHVRLAMYSDVTGLLVVVAPRGWSCVADLGADGSGGLTVYPPDGPKPDGYGAVPSSARAITARTDSGCQGCTATRVCTLVPESALVQAVAVDRDPACTSLPARETVVRLGTNVVAFEDPAGYPGHGAPSGGPYPANGVVVLQQPVTDVFTDWIATCTLSVDQHDMCTAVLHEFVTRYQS